MIIINTRNFPGPFYKEYQYNAKPDMVEMFRDDGCKMVEFCYTITETIEFRIFFHRTEKHR